MTKKSMKSSKEATERERHTANTNTNKQTHKQNKTTFKYIIICSKMMMSSSNTATTTNTTPEEEGGSNNNNNNEKLVVSRQQLRSMPPPSPPSSSSSVPADNNNNNNNNTKTTTATTKPSWSAEETPRTGTTLVAASSSSTTTTTARRSSIQRLFRRFSSTSSSYKMGSFRERSSVFSSVVSQAQRSQQQQQQPGGEGSSLMTLTASNKSSSLQSSKIQEEEEQEEKKEQEFCSDPIPPSRTATATATIRRNVNDEYTVMAFINSTSGGGKGSKVYDALVELLGSDYVVDLKRCCSSESNKLRPEDYLLPLSHDFKTRILICGGDGTMGWIASSIDKVLLLNKKNQEEENNEDNEQQEQQDLLLPFACLPLGTGNDLSRVLDWGKSYGDALGKGGPKRQRRNLQCLIQDICVAPISKLDRWRLQIVPTSEPLTIEMMSKLTEKKRDSLEESLRETQSQQEEKEKEKDEEEEQEEKESEGALLLAPPKMNNQSSLTEDLINSWVSEKLQSMELKESSSLSPSLPAPPESSNNMNVAKEDDQQQQQQQQTMTPPPTTTTSTAGICNEAFDGLFCNYFSIGFDAEIALDFHKEREALKAAKTAAKRSRIRNKLAYVESAFRLGLNSAPPLKDIIQVMIESSSSSTTKSESDNETSCISSSKKEMVELPVPEFCRSILLLNIPSFGGGNNLSENVSNKKKKKKKHNSDGNGDCACNPSSTTTCCDYSDGLIEIYFLPNLTKFALTLALRGGVFKPVCRVERVLIQTLTEVPCEVDGEPWKQSSSIFEISHTTKSAVLVGDNKTNNHHKNKKHQHQHQHQYQHQHHGSESSKNQTKTTAADIADPADPTSKRIIDKNKNDDNNKTSVGGVGFLDGLCCRSTAAIEE